MRLYIKIDCPAVVSCYLESMFYVKVLTILTQHIVTNNNTIVNRQNGISLKSTGKI